MIVAMWTADGAEPKHATVLIRGGTVIDGTGAPGRVADVAISGDRIVEIAPNLAYRADRTVKANGMVVAPGFIDSHNHSAAALLAPARRMNESFLRQGVTTVMLGPDGETSPAQMREMLDKFSAQGIGTNVGFYVGHNGIRTEVLGKDQNRAPTAAELGRMESLVREGMEFGAVGLSTGLMYTPGLFSSTGEVIALAKQVEPFGGVYETHVRDPNKAVLSSDWEAIEIARQAGIPLNLTHLTTPGKDTRGLMRAVIDLVEDAQKEGMAIVADQYPYPAVATAQLWAVLNYPNKLALDSRDKIRAALRDSKSRALIREETVSGGESGFSQYKASGPNSILVLSSPDLPAYENKFISEVAAERGVDGFEAVAYLLENSKADVVVSLGGFYEEDMRMLTTRPWVMIASDGDVPRIGPAANLSESFRSLHPRATGAFPRVLGKYVREEKLLEIEDAVRRMTSAPAQFLNLPQRGKLAPGHAADLVIFDPKTIADRSTWKEPNLAPVGIATVIVNGELALDDGKLTDAAAGRFVRHDAPALPLSSPNKHSQRQ
jgi:N-acyl-D-aspartate/D-glutamate deacylase